MKKFLIIFLFIPLTVLAYRVQSPPKIVTFKEDKIISALNNHLEDIHSITNGRYTMNVTTTNPDGDKQGDVGDFLLLITGGKYYLEVNVDGSTTWKGIELINTP